MPVQRISRKATLLSSLGGPFAMVSLLFIITGSGIFIYLQRIVDAERQTVEVELPAMNRSQALTSHAALLQTISLSIDTASRSGEVTDLGRRAALTEERMAGLIAQLDVGVERAALLGAGKRIREATLRQVAIRLEQIEADADILQQQDKLLGQLDSFIDDIDWRIDNAANSMPEQSDELKRRLAGLPEGVEAIRDRVESFERSALLIDTFETMRRSLSTLRSIIALVPLQTTHRNVAISAQQHRLQVRALATALHYLQREDRRVLVQEISTLREAERADGNLYLQSRKRIRLAAELATIERTLTRSTQSLIDRATRVREASRQSMTNASNGLIAQLEGFKRYVLVLCALTLLLLLLTCYAVLYRMTIRPLQRLTQDVDRVVGERSASRAVRHPIREIDELAGAVEQLQESNRIRAEQEALLRDRNRALGLANSALEQFADVASHDLQEPLRTLQQYSQALAEDYDTRLDDQGRYYLSTITGSAKRMSQLISDTLEYSKTAAEDTPRTDVALDELIADLRIELANLISDTSAQLETRELPVVHANRTGLEQLFRNLISNAIRYARPGVTPQVRIHGCRTASGAAHELHITDNGIGIDQRYLAKIFEPFERLNPRDSLPGTGIGLAICQRVCEAHGWQITVVSEPGSGSTFTIHLSDESVVATPIPQHASHTPRELAPLPD